MANGPDDGSMPGDESTVRPEQFEWVCQECGRGHPKHSPPCSRCGHMHLEKEPISYDLDDAEAPSYFDVGKWHVVAIVVLVALVGLVAAGVISVPELGGPPSIDDAPGEEERAAGIDLVETETLLRERLNEHRSEDGLSDLAAGEEHDAIATYHNRHRAVAAHDDDVERPTPREDYAEFDHECSYAPAFQSFPVSRLGIDGSIHAYDSEAELGDAVADALVAAPGGDGAVMDDYEAIGVDIHVYPNDDVYVSLFLC
ncbi:MAG TPA: hypothetical protein VKM69_06095 [Natronoarchaeum rubrum]|nr:hypothetical protein [Natronoarchaeum rubrum]